MGASAESIYLNILAALCVILGTAVFWENMRFFRNGLPRSVRPYLLAKGVVALFVAVVYALTLVSLFTSAPPSGLTRALMVLMLFLMLIDTFVREAEAHTKVRMLDARQLLTDTAEAMKADAPVDPPQETVEVVPSE